MGGGLEVLARPMKANHDIVTSTDFRALFESAPGLFVAIEPDPPLYTVVAASDAYLRARERTRDEVVGRGLFESGAERLEAPLAASLLRVIQFRAPDLMDGALSSPIFDRNGELRYIVHRLDEPYRSRAEDAPDDILLADSGATSHSRRTPGRSRTELSLRARTNTDAETTENRLLRQAQAALRLSEVKFAGIVAASADAIISIDEEQRITTFNERAEVIFGYSKAEMLGMPLDALIPGRFRDAHREHVRSFAEGQESARGMGRRDVPTYGVRKNGEEFLVGATISKLEIGGERLLIVSLRDVSEEARAESEQRLLAELGEVVVSAGSDYQRLLTDVAAAVVRNIADWCTVDVLEDGDVRRLRVVHADPTKADVCAALEQVRIQRGGRSIIAEALTSQKPVLVSEVTPEYLMSIAESPEHHRLLRELQPRSFLVVPLIARDRAVGTLALGSSRPSRRFCLEDQRIVERLASCVALAMDNARTHEALERAVRAREEVLGIVAHDLRNPLNAIVLRVQGLLRDRGEPERRDRTPLDAIYRSAVRMNRLIQDLLDVSRLEGGSTLPITQLAVSASTLLADATEPQRGATAQAGRTLDVVAPAELPQVWADRARVQQVFDNLIGNAIKFSRARIRVSAHVLNDEVMFSVENDGFGLSQDDLPHVFDRFWQASKTDRRGAGLGLSIVKGIVLAHHGRVWVDSGDFGTTFYFTLPRAQTATP